MPEISFWQVLIQRLGPDNELIWTIFLIDRKKFSPNGAYSKAQGIALCKNGNKIQSSERAESHLNLVLPRCRGWMVQDYALSGLSENGDLVHSALRYADDGAPSGLGILGRILLRFDVKGILRGLIS